MAEQQKIVSVYFSDEYFKEGNRQMQERFRLQHYWVSRVTLRLLATGGVCRAYTFWVSMALLVMAITSGFLECERTFFAIWSAVFCLLGWGSFLMDRWSSKSTLEWIEKNNEQETQDQP